VLDTLQAQQVGDARLCKQSQFVDSLLISQWV
jgi:hypothetical protein